MAGRFHGTKRALLFTPPAAVVPGGATTTWNPSDKDAGISLSNGNLTVTGDSADFISVRAIASASSGKKYWELLITTLNATQYGYGMGDASAALNGIAPGFDSHGVSLLNGLVYCNGSAIGSVDVAAQGDTIGFAVDLTANLFWVRVNAGDWNGNGADNPATGAGGHDISARAAGAYFPMAVCGRFGTGNDVLTANFGGTAYAQTPPSGFGNW